MIRRVTFPLEIGLRDVHVFAEQIRQFVAAGIVDQRSAIGMNIFKRDPRRRQIPERIRGHVDGIGMDALLRTLMRRDRLQSFRLVAGQRPDPLQKSGMLQNPAERGNFLCGLRKRPG